MSAIEFREYPSIEHASRLGPAMLDHPPAVAVEWLAVEKVHGANMSVYFDGTQLKLGKRSSMLEQEHFAKFNNVGWMTTELSEQVATAFKLVKAAHEHGPKIASIAIYGEMAGGEYPHPDVPRHLGARRVQKGVYYSPRNIFMVFDIRPRLVAEALVDEDATGDAAVQDAKTDDTTGADATTTPAGPRRRKQKGSLWLPYLPYDQVLEICSKAGLIALPPLHRGPLKTLLALDPSFKTTVPQMLGLPALPEFPNIAEGYVIRPAVEMLTPKTGQRLIMKHKSPIWSEVVAAPRTIDPATAPIMSREEIESIARPYITANRLAAVKSKELDDIAPDKLLRLLADDAMGDLSKDYPALVSEPSLHRSLDKALHRMAIQLVIHGTEPSESSA